MRSDSWAFVVLVLVLMTRPVQAFMIPTPLVFPVLSSRMPNLQHRTAVICSAKQPAPGAGGRASKMKRTPRKVPSGRRRSNKFEGAGERPGRPTPSSSSPAAPSPPEQARPALSSPPPSRDPANSRKRKRPAERTKVDAKDSDMHVLVPVKDVLPMPLADIAETVADSLGLEVDGVDSKATRVSMQRFCLTLESVFRTEFSVKVDRANAGSVLGGRRYLSRSKSSAGGRGGSSGGSSGTGLLASTEEAGEQYTRALVSPGTSDGADGQADPAATELATDSSNSDSGEKRKRNKWRMGLRLRKKREGAGGGEKSARLIPATATAVAAGDGRSTRRRGGPGKRSNGNGGGGGDGDTTHEAAVVPLLALVEELVQSAMFSPIGARDVMMSEALAAEFRTAAGVRPVFGNLANVFELLRHWSPEDEEGQDEEGGSRAKDSAAKRVSRIERDLVPFEGRLLMFRRGNGVEETEGRLLLRKLDYLQSNAVGWLSQSITDSLRARQQQVLTVVDAVARDFARRKDKVVRSWAEAAIAFGLERESFAKYLSVANATEIALTKEQEVLNEALGALRRNSRRAPVSLTRYGTRQINVNIKEFAKGGAWPPEDDSWFWDEASPKLGRDAQVDVSDEGAGGAEFPPGENEVPSTVLPRVTLASVLSSPSVPRRPAESPVGSNGSGSRSGRSRSISTSNGGGGLGADTEKRSILSRLLSKCTVVEPTYDEVVVVYFKRRRRPIFRAPPAVTMQWRFWSKVGNKIRGVEQAEAKSDDAEEAKGAGLGLQLRVYRGVPLVNLNAIAPDKKVEVRPQTALRLDLNSVVGLGLLLANLRFDSPVLVIAATVSVVLLVIRTIVAYLNARVRVESFVSRDILDKTMGSNVPVLRHLAEEAAQQKSRHVALVYAALLRCAIGASSTLTATDAADWLGWSDLTVVSIAAVSRHCGDFLSSLCLGGDCVPSEAKVDIPYWVEELENLKILVRVDPDREGRAGDEMNKDISRSLPLALEGLRAASSVAAETAGSEAAASTSSVVFYRLLDPEAAVGQLKLKWSELVEPPAAGEGSHGGIPKESTTPWAQAQRPQ